MVRISSPLVPPVNRQVTFPLISSPFIPMQLKTKVHDTPEADRRKVRFLDIEQYAEVGLISAERLVVLLVFPFQFFKEQ